MSNKLHYFVRPGKFSCDTDGQLSVFPTEENRSAFIEEIKKYWAKKGAAPNFQIAYYPDGLTINELKELNKRPKAYWDKYEWIDFE